MSIASSIRGIIKPTAPTLPVLGPASGQRLDAIERRTSLRRKATQIADKKRDVALRLAALTDAPVQLAASEKALADGLVAVELGQKPSAPLETLGQAAEKARIRDGEARQQALTLQAALDAYDAQSAPLAASLQAIHRELADLVPAILDERLVARKARRDQVIAEALAVLREERIDCVAFDEYSTASAGGEFRGSHDYTAIHIPSPNHPAFKPEHPDVFERGRQLAAIHDAHGQEERSIQREAQALLAELLNGE